MLRISTHDDSQSLTFRLEGKLAGPWVRELEDCWHTTLAAVPRPTVRVDLTAVTFIDAGGKAFLAAAHRHGAQLVAAGCLMRAMVAEITGASIPDRGCSC